MFLLQIFVDLSTPYLSMQVIKITTFFKVISSGNLSSHCVKSVQIRSFSGPYLPVFRLDYMLTCFIQIIIITHQIIFLSYSSEFPANP